MKLCLACNSKFESSTWICPECSFAPSQHQEITHFAPALSQSNAGFPPESFARLFTKESNNFWFSNRNQLINWALKEHFPGASNLLGIGCGTGFVLAGISEAFPHLEINGSEIFTNGLIHAATRLRAAKLFQMDARAIPFVEEFDVIGAFDVLEHIEEDEAVLVQMRSALRPGGGIILTVPQHRFLWSVVDEYSCHVRRYEAKELEDKLTRSGFSIERRTSFVSLLLPVLMLVRMSHGYTKKNYNPDAEYQISDWLNAALGQVLTLERKTIEAGLSYGAGGSLLARGGR